MLILQLAFDGLVVGCLYAMMAVSFAMILNTTKIWHFAHAGTYALGAYSMYVMFTLWHLPLVMAMAGAIAITAALGIAYERWAYEPLRARNSQSLTFFIASLILSVLFENLLLLVFQPDPKTLMAQSTAATHTLGGLSYTNWSVAVLITSLLVLGGVMAFYRLTRTGQAAIALATNPTMASVIGIDANRIYRVIFAIGSALTVPVAYLVGQQTGIKPGMGQSILLSAVVATVVGGLGSIPGTFLGGILIGVLEGVAVWKLPSEWQSAVSYAVLFLIIIFRPSGLMGIKMRTSKV